MFIMYCMKTKAKVKVLLYRRNLSSRLINSAVVLSSLLMIHSIIMINFKIYLLFRSHPQKFQKWDLTAVTPSTQTLPYSRNVFQVQILVMIPISKSRWIVRYSSPFHSVSSHETHIHNQPNNNNWDPQSQNSLFYILVFEEGAFHKYENEKFVTELGNIMPNR